MISKGYLSLYTLFGGFAPNSETAKILSENLGYKTVLSGSVSKGKNDPSQSLQMIQRPLLTTDELKSLQKGNFIVMKTGTNPMRTCFKLFKYWGIKLSNEYSITERTQQNIKSGSLHLIIQRILQSQISLSEKRKRQSKTIGNNRKGTLRVLK